MKGLGRLRSTGTGFRTLERAGIVRTAVGSGVAALDRPVSIVTLGGDVCVMATPAALLLVNIAAGQVEVLGPPAPGGLAFDPIGRHIIASNGVEAVLLPLSDPTEPVKRFPLVKARLLRVSADGAWLATAGNGLVSLHRGVADPEPAWTVEVDEPAALCFGPAALYVTSRKTGRITALALDDGRELVAAGRRGFFAPAGDLLDPCGMTLGADGRLIVADRLTGCLTAFDPETLEPLLSTGGNGPGLRFLDMPVAIDTIASGIVVACDDGRICRLSHDLSSLQATIVHPERQWTALERDLAEGRVTVEARGPIGWDADEHGVRRFNGPTLTVLGEPYRPGYGLLHSPLSHKTIHVPGAEFVEFATASGGAFVFSSHGVPRYVAEVGALYCLPCTAGPVRWRLAGGRVYGDDGLVDLDALEQSLLARIRQAEARRHPNGLLPAAALVEAWGGLGDRDKLDHILERGPTARLWTLHQAWEEVERLTAAAGEGSDPWSLESQLTSTGTARRWAINTAIEGMQKLSAPWLHSLLLGYVQESAFDLDTLASVCSLFGIGTARLTELRMPERPAPFDGIIVPPQAVRPGLAFLGPMRRPAARNRDEAVGEVAGIIAAVHRRFTSGKQAPGLKTFDELADSGQGHCGNFATLAGYLLSEAGYLSRFATIEGAHDIPHHGINRIYTDYGEWTADAQLGVLYLHSIAEMMDDPAKAEDCVVVSTDCRSWYEYPAWRGEAFFRMLTRSLLDHDISLGGQLQTHIDGFAFSYGEEEKIRELLLADNPECLWLETNRPPHTDKKPTLRVRMDWAARHHLWSVVLLAADGYDQGWPPQTILSVFDGETRVAHFSVPTPDFLYGSVMFWLPAGIIGDRIELAFPQFGYNRFSQDAFNMKGILVYGQEAN